jgi:hypothetical protein
LELLLLRYLLTTWTRLLRNFRSADADRAIHHLKAAEFLIVLTYTLLAPKEMLM